MPLRKNIIKGHLLHELGWRHGTQLVSDFEWDIHGPSREGVCLGFVVVDVLSLPFHLRWGKGTAIRKLKQLSVKSWISLFGPFCEELASLRPTFYQHACRSWLTKFLVWEKISIHSRSLCYIYCAHVLQTCLAIGCKIKWQKNCKTTNQYVMSVHKRNMKHARATAFDYTNLLAML